MSKIDELLAVLDLPEEEQSVWLFDRFATSFMKKMQEVGDRLKWEENEWRSTKQDAMSNQVADLAFRLRDEIGEGRMFDDLNCEEAVYKYRVKENYRPEMFTSWWICHSKPIHWIIAALIAKELAKEQENAG